MTTLIYQKYSKISDLSSYLTPQSYYTSESDIINISGRNYYNKYKVENDTITEGYSCFAFEIPGLEPVCIQGGDESYYTANREILEELDSTFRANGGECSDNSINTGNFECSLNRPDIDLSAYDRLGAESDTLFMPMNMAQDVISTAMVWQVVLSLLSEFGCENMN